MKHFLLMKAKKKCPDGGGSEESKSDCKNPKKTNNLKTEK